jgi:hypothetical protein
MHVTSFRQIQGRCGYSQYSKTFVCIIFCGPGAGAGPGAAGHGGGHGRHTTLLANADSEQTGFSVWVIDLILNFPMRLPPLGFYIASTGHPGRALERADAGARVRRRGVPRGPGGGHRLLLELRRPAALRPGRRRGPGAAHRRHRRGPPLRRLRPRRPAWPADRGVSPPPPPQPPTPNPHPNPAAANTHSPHVALPVRSHALPLHIEN